MPSGKAGQFLNEDFLKLSVNTGRLTDVDEALDIPLVQPRIALILAGQLPSRLSRPLSLHLLALQYCAYTPIRAPSPNA